jgi:3',5'-cyclic AMP phosphodiesterase CpdA
MRLGGAPTAWITALLLSLGAGCVPSESPEVRVAGSGSTAGGGDSHANVDDSAHSGDSSPDSNVDSNVDSGADSGVLSLRVAVVSDLNGSYGSTSYSSAVDDAVSAILADPPDLVLSTGDMVAGQKSGLDYAAMWDGFHEAVSDRLAAARIPFAVTPGNHDASGYAGYEGERDVFEATWADRKPDLDFVDDAHYPFRYAFRMNNVLFVSLDDTLVGPLDSAQSAWLADVLDTPAAARIVYGHVPLYPFTEGRQTEALFDSDLEDLLVAHSVTVFISGHHHAYYPGRRDALRLVGTACLGDGPRALLGTAQTSERAVLRLTLTDGAIDTLDAYAGDGFDTVIQRSSLPVSVGSGSDVIDRDDR